MQIHMVTRLASGDAAVAAAEAAFADGASDKAAQFLREAKSFYHRAQVRTRMLREGAREGFVLPTSCR